MIYHGIAFLCGFLLDLLLGDPEDWPHPVRWIGKLISVLDEKFMGKPEDGVIQKKSDGRDESDQPERKERKKGKTAKVKSAEKGEKSAEAETSAKDEKAAEAKTSEKGGKAAEVKTAEKGEKATEAKTSETGKHKGRKLRNKHREFRLGILLVLIVVLASAAVAAILLIAGYKIHPAVGIVIESILTYWLLAVKSLRTESMAVYRRLAKGNLKSARKQVARIVGRDTDVLDEAGVARACVETIAESTCDGILAPMLYTAIGGPVLGFAAKAINTMDSMVGYKNDRYRHFGCAAARIDDAVNFLPARLSAWLIIAAAYLFGKQFSGPNALKIYRRDHTHSASPNAGHPESAIAGAMGIQLGGGAVYSGRFLKKDPMGDPLKRIDKEDIRRANKLMMAASVIAEVIFVLLILFVAIL